MKKMLLGAVGLSAALASCGVGGAPDGSGSGFVSEVRTEYRTEGGKFVSCDNVNNALASTQVSVYFSVFGDVDSVDVGLRGNTTDEYDDNYNFEVTGQQLNEIGGNDYRLTFTANPAVDGFLPQAIIVNPARTKVKIVNTSDKAGSFHADLKVDTGSAMYSFNSQNLLAGRGNVDVYPSCTVIRTTNEDV